MQTRISNIARNFIIKSPTTQRVLKLANDNPSLTNSLFVFGLSTTIRPLTIWNTTENEQDKKYGAAKSMATGIADLTVSGLIFIPLNSLLVKAQEKLINHPLYQDTKKFEAVKTLINRGGKLVLLPLQSFALFWLIPKVVDKVIGSKKLNEDKLNGQFISKAFDKIV